MTSMRADAESHMVLQQTEVTTTSFPYIQNTKYFLYSHYGEVLNSG